MILRPAVQKHRALALGLVFLLPIDLPPASAQSNRVELVESPPEGGGARTPGTVDAAGALLDLVRDARRSIDLQDPRLTDGAPPAVDPLVAALSEAARRGVKIRILLESRRDGTSGTSDALLAGVSNIERRTIAYPAAMRGQVLIVDQTQALLASRNAEPRGRALSHELGVVFTGRLVDRLERMFEHDWDLAATLAAGGKATVPDYVRRRGGPEIGGLLANGPLLAVSPPLGGHPAAIDVLQSLIDGAKRSLAIQVTRLGTEGSPRWVEVRDALARAARRNVAIRITVSDRQFRAREGLEDLRFVARLPGARVRYSALPSQPQDGCLARFDNAKYMVVDGDVSWIGTGDWTAQDFYSARHLAFASVAPEFARKVAAVFETNWSSPHARRFEGAMGMPPPAAQTCRASAVK